MKTLAPPPRPEAPPSDSPADPLVIQLGRAAAGDATALAGVLQVVGPLVLAATRALLGPKHPDLEDVVQEALIAVHDAVPRFRGDSSFVHYARRIAVRIALAARRRRPDPPAVDLTELDAPGLDEPLPDRIARHRRTAAFRRLLDELPPVQAESLALRVVLGYSLPQVADATGVPLNTVRSRIRLAKEHLKERIVSDPALADLFDLESQR